MPNKAIEIPENGNELTRRKREEIFKIIRGRIGPDDRLPEEIIRDDFNGNEDEYLRAMADLYGIKI